MTAWLISLLKARWQYLVVGLLVTVTLAYTYHQGRVHGRAVAELECAIAQKERDRQDAAALIRWTAHIDALELARQEAEERAANIVTETVIEYLPGKTEVRREVVERPVYRDCAVSQRVFDIANAALGGNPLAAVVPGS